MATQAFVRALTTNEQAGNAGFTHEVVFGPGYNELSETTTNTAMTFNLFKALAGDVMVKAALIAKPAFDDTGHTISTTTFSFGDADSATQFINAVELNVNGTEVLYTYDNTAFGPYTATKQLTVTIGSPGSGKSLSTLNTGKAVLLIQLIRLTTLTDAAG